MTRVQVYTCLILLMALVACNKQVSEYTPPPCPAKSSLTLANGWPAWCAPQLVVPPQEQCVYKENSDPTHRKFGTWAASAGSVGSGVRFLFTRPLTASVPVAYLGPSSKEYGSPIWMHFLYGRAITPPELLYDSSLKKYVSRPVWGLPLLGTHVYRLAGRQIEVQVNSLPTGNTCQSVQDIVVAEKDLRPSFVPDHSESFRVQFSGNNPLSYKVNTDTRRLYADSSATTFLYVSWSSDTYPDPETAPNWAFLSLSNSDSWWTYSDSAIEFRIPTHEDVGMVIDNVLCGGLKYQQLIDNAGDPYMEESWLRLEEYKSLFLYERWRFEEPVWGDGLLKYDWLGIILTCSMINVEYRY